MYRQAGTTPNFTDIARRYGMNRHTVAKYWKAGGQVEDARRCRPSGLDRHREVIEAKAQLPGATKRGIYEYLIDRCYAGEEPPAYNTLTKWMRRNGIECGRPPEGPEPHPRFETAPGEQMQFDWKESLRMADAEGELAMRYGVMNIPTVIFFKDGKEIAREVGALPPEAFARILDENL